MLILQANRGKPTRATLAPARHAHPRRLGFSGSARPLPRLDVSGQQRKTQEQQLAHRDGPIPGWRMHRPVEAGPVVRVRNRNVGINVTQGVKGPSGRVGPRRLVRRIEWQRRRPLLRRTVGRRPLAPPPRSGAERPSGTDLWRGSDPWEGGRRVVKTHSPLCRTKPSGRGVAPATARAAGAPRAIRPLIRKTLLHRRISRTASVNRGQSEV